MKSVEEADQRYIDILQEAQKRCANDIAMDVDLGILKNLDYEAFAVGMIVRDRPDLADKVFYREWCSDVALRDDPEYPNGKCLAHFTDDFMVWEKVEYVGDISPPMIRRIP